MSSPRRRRSKSCSRLRKAFCQPPDCVWIKGKGCKKNIYSSPVRIVRSPIKSPVRIAVPSPVKSPKRSKPKRRKIVPILITEDIHIPETGGMDEATALQRQTELLPMDLILKLNKGEATESDLYSVVLHLNRINAMGRYWTIDSLADYTGLNKRFEASKGLQGIIDHYLQQEQPVRRRRRTITHPVPRTGKRCPAGSRFNKKDKLCHPKHY